VCIAWRAKRERVAEDEDATPARLRQDRGRACVRVPLPPLLRLGLFPGHHSDAFPWWELLAEEKAWLAEARMWSWGTRRASGAPVPSLALPPPWQTSPWGYVYDNAAYPPALLPVRAGGLALDVAFSQLEQFALPSPTLFAAVSCVRDECVTLSETLEGQQACQCGSWVLACQLGSDTAPPQTQAFCASLAAGGTACSGLDGELVTAMTATAAPRVLQACSTAW